MAIVKEMKDGNTIIRFADDCIQSPEEVKRIWEQVSAITRAALLEQANRKKGLEYEKRMDI